MRRPEKSQRPMDPKENHLRDICKDVVEELNRSQSWKLDPEDRNEFLERIGPHVAASGTVLLPEHEIIQRVRTIAGFYFQEGHEVEHLGQDQISYVNYQEFIKKSTFAIINQRGPLTQALVLKKGIEDFVNDIWVKILSKKMQFHFRSKLTTWIYRVIENSIKELEREEEKVQVISLNQPYGDDNRDLIEIIPGPPNDILMWLEKEEDIRSEEKNISKRRRNADRDIKIWRMVQAGNKHREIAKTLSVPINTVSTIISRLNKIFENRPQKQG
jgi:RNA polymerase sigma factor (sigma-70 family)